MVSGGGKRVQDKRRESAYPAARTLVWHSTLRHAGSRHAEVLQSLAVTQQLELCLPDANGAAVAQTLRWENSFFYEIRSPLSVFLSARFIQEYVLQGHVYMMPKNVPLDSDNTVMLLPSGELLLLVDSSMYEQLGFVGKKYGDAMTRALRAAQGRLGQRYVITLDLKSKAFAATDEPTESSKPSFRQRVLECLEHRIEPMDMMVCAYTDSGSPRTIIFGNDDEIQRKRVDLSTDLTQIPDVFMPQFASFFTGLAGSEAVGSGPERQQALSAALSDAYDWLGLVACRFTDVLQRKLPDEYVSTFTGIPDAIECQAEGQLSCVRWRGLISPAFGKTVFEKAQQAVRTGKVPWATLTGWGFPDAMVSWTQTEAKLKREHGYVVNGSNNYTFLLLPNDEYFLLQALGSHDATV